MMGLDIMAAMLCGAVAMCLFTVHVITSPRRHHWLTLPEYIRHGILATGVTFTLRAVNFTDLQPSGAGHINAEGAIALITMAYTVGAVTFWAVGKITPHAHRGEPKRT